MSYINYFSLLLFGATCSFLYADLLGRFIPSWRELSTYAALPTLPIILVLFVMPESPRWLLSTGKKLKAEKVNHFESLLAKSTKKIGFKMNWFWVARKIEIVAGSSFISNHIFLRLPRKHRQWKTVFNFQSISGDESGGIAAFQHRT